MALVGGPPDTGIRVTLERSRLRGGPPWSYEGHVAVQGVEHPVAVTVTADGRAEVTTPGPTAGAAAVRSPAVLDGALLDRVRLLVRAAVKHGRSEDGGSGAPPWRIVRWRPGESW